MFGGERGIGAEAVLVAADQAMYRAKEEGRNQIALFQDPAEPQRQQLRRQTTSARIRDALTQDRLSLAHAADPQPRLGRDRALRAAAADDRRERRAAAGRLLHRGGGALRHGAGARPLGRRPGARSCSPSASGTAIRSRCTSTSPAPRSPTSRCSNSSSGRLDEGDADPARCTFEITETAPVHDYEAAAGFADRITEFGCQVAIDDYGAGFGPFHYLKSIPFDLIKIDGSFIRDMPNSDADQLTVQAIVQIARGLGKTTIAEYVQDDVTAQMLREYGVDMAQGYHLGRPVDVAEAL